MYHEDKLISMMNHVIDLLEENNNINRTGLRLIISRHNEAVKSRKTELEFLLSQFNNIDLDGDVLSED